MKRFFITFAVCESIGQCRAPDLWQVFLNQISNSHGHPEMLVRRHRGGECSSDLSEHFSNSVACCGLPHQPVFNAPLEIEYTDLHDLEIDAVR